MLLDNRYQLKEPLGHGGAGVVYRAIDVTSQRPVAIKQLATSAKGPDEGVKRLQREAELLNRLAHPNIVGFYELGEVDGQPYLVMEYIDGCTLRDLLEAQREPLPVEIVKHIIDRVLSALSAAHQAGITHRDLKPENIMLIGVKPHAPLDQATFRPEIKVMDFGLAYLSGEVRITNENLVAGTALYLAPEAVLGQSVDSRADLYAVGVILYELVAGRPPFMGTDPLVVISQHLHATPISPRWHNARLPSALASLILKLLAKNPADRYQDAAAAAAELETIQQTDSEDRPLTRTSLLEAIARGRLVGREEEITLFHNAIDRMLGGSGQVIFVEGDPGIGKSRLIREAGVYARLRGVQVFSGHCFDADLALPYQPFIELVKKYVQTNIKPGSTGHVPANQAAELIRLAPGLEAHLGATPTPVEVSPAEARLRLFEAVVTLLADGPSPLMLILENMHWAHPPDFALLLHLAQAVARHHRLLLVVTYRGSRAQTDSSQILTKTLNELNRLNLAGHLRLSPLSANHVTELLETLLEGEVAASFSQAIFEISEGNPFFVEEILKALIEDGRMYRDPDLGRWEGANLEGLEIPASIKDVIGRRIEKLSPTHHRILELAALLGRRFRIDALLAAVEGELDEAEVLDTLEEAVNMQLISRIPPNNGDKTDIYTFEHSLLRSTLFDGLTSLQQVRLHRQIAHTLEKLNQSQGRSIAAADELAYHFSIAGGEDTEKAISYSLIAVDNALQVYASEVAAKHYQMILDLLDEEDIPRRVWILEQLGDLYFHRTRQMVDAVAAYEWAIQLWQKAANPDPPALIRLYRKMGEIARYWQGGHMERVDTYLIEAMQLLDEDPAQAESLERARVLAAMAFNLNARGATKSAEESALNLAQKAAHLAKRLNAADEETTALDALQRIYRKQGDLDAAHEIDRRRLALIPRMHNPTEAVDANLGASQMGWETGDLAAATEFCLEALTLARRTDNIGGQWEALRRLVMLHLQWGRLPNADTYARQGVELGPRAGLLEFGEPVEALFRTQLAILQTLQGENEAAARELAELSALYPTTEALPYHFALGWLNYENEEWDEAEQNLESGHAFPPPFLPARFDLVLLVEVYGHLGDEAALNQVWPAAQTEAGRWESPYLLAILNRGMGAFHTLQEEWADAEAAFKRALAVTHRTTLLYQDARTWLDYGRMLARRNEPGDLDMARDCLSEAQHMFLNFGAYALAEKAWIEVTRLSQ